MMECGRPSLFFTLSIGPQREIGLLIEPKNTYINHLKNFGAFVPIIAEISFLVMSSGNPPSTSLHSW